ncbi:glycosyltransferase family 29 protein [Sphingomonas sabuli]|uniref:Glycosyltransferase family 29 protein n=1 Tax=Sphingomonas sabuli TaxID=2764186 RepID=A0A7G9L5B7_9SPHN|nr:glycosyltransferase family 29 protein [Sphingomonas sabuli]QNM83816.1 glycosyltransferase family 29 protein [Sphingomonas sabuli]
MPDRETDIAVFTLEGDGSAVRVQVLRHDPSGKSLAWAGIHAGPLTSKTVEVDIANLVGADPAIESDDDRLIVRVNAIEAAGSVTVHGPTIRKKPTIRPPLTPGASGPQGLRWPVEGTEPETADTVLVFGTFDVENYGDLLFPIIAGRRLERAGLAITAVSPTSVKTAYDDAPAPIAFDALAACNPPGKAVLIGGGNIIHLRHTALPDYQDGNLRNAAYPALWVGATSLAAAYGLPVVWNAPGVPFAEQGWPAGDMLSATAAAADYLSVRDDNSRLALGVGGAAATIVPDSAVEISRVWPLEEQEPRARAVLERAGADPAGSYIAVHVKERSLGGSLEELAEQLDALAADTGRTVVLVAIGPCHGDDDVARRLGEAMQSSCVVLDRPASLQDIAAIIACADLTLCSSLHAYITSFSYGIPGVLVSLRHNLKFEAFAELVGRADDCVYDWDSALAAARSRLDDAPDRRDLLAGPISEQLDRHWDVIVAALSDPAAGNDRRAGFLRTLTAIQLKAAGAAMALPDAGSRVPASRLMTPFDLVSRFAGKPRMVIVGNAPSLRGSGRGEWIDGFDVVVRFNGCAIHGFEQDVGSRTDILVTNPYTETFHRAPADGLDCGMVLVIAPQTQRGDKAQFAQWAGDQDVLFTYTPDIYGEDLPARTGSLTTGVYAVSLLRRILRPALLGVTGFTMFQEDTAHYWSDTMPSGVKSHDLGEDAATLIGLLNGFKGQVAVTSELAWLARRIGMPLSDRIQVEPLNDPQWAEG